MPYEERAPLERAVTALRKAGLNSCSVLFVHCLAIQVSPFSLREKAQGEGDRSKVNHTFDPLTLDPLPEGEGILDRQTRTIRYRTAIEAGLK